MGLMSLIYIAVAALIIFGLGVAYLLIRRRLAEQKIRIAEESAKRILEDAKRDAETKRREAILEVKDEALKMRANFERETRERKGELSVIERRLMQKEENLDKKEDVVKNQERDLQRKIGEIDKIKEDLETKRKDQIKELERIAGVSREDAKALLLQRVEKDLDHEVAVRIKNAEEKIKKEADFKAKRIVSTAIQRCAVDLVVESVVTTVNIPSDEMKGRIIGREGRNIRTFETLTGIDLIVDDTPEAVILSGFDPLRREQARLTLEKLVVDGRIHPARVEEMFEKAKQELKVAIWQHGEKAAMDVDVHGLPPVIIQMLGRLKYRTSYGQNVLQHSIEAAHIAGMLATELGVNVKLAKRAALLHDLGKAITHEVEGPHAKLGALFAQKAGESPEVVHAIEAHHEDVEPQTIEAVIVLVADAISASRPGARRDTLEAYIKRLEKLESVAKSFEGVEKSYAIQAGREIRITVQPDKMDDLASTKLAHDVARKIEAELEYPGEVRVTVIRETRATDIAK